MNKLRYCIIFNKNRGQLMVVAETASSQGKTARQRTKSASNKHSSERGFCTLMRSAAFACLLTLGHPIFFGTVTSQGMLYAQAIADPNAPANQRPTVLTAPNGVPMVNIQTPSVAGVSRNTYSQFDVQQNGVILNNSRANVQTQLGGWVQGNPWLATGSARIIVNEVNSSNPSQLRGYVEVGGQRAEVIIANPSGVNIDGGGFINASRATITTGAPLINGGNLEGYLVQRGNVSVNGKGLDASGTDYTGILARAVQVNAGIWAKDLRVITGVNQISSTHDSATTGLASGTTPSFALDVAELGGMYAGQIHLIGTEAGIGVRNAGIIAASAGEVQLSANGLLTNKNLISATGSATLIASGGIDNSGIIYSQQNTSLSTQNHIVNSNLIAAQGNANLTATGASSQISNAPSAIVVAGLLPDNTLSGESNLTVQATVQANIQGRALATGNFTAQANALDLQSSEVSAQNVTLKALTQDINASAAKISATRILGMQAGQTLRTDAATINANELSIAAHALSNVSGTIIQTSKSNLSIHVDGGLDNTQGRIASNSTNLNLQSQSLSNTQGTIEHAGDGLLHITTGTFNGQSGAINSSAALKIEADTIDHRQAKINAQQITIEANSLDNRQASILAQGANTTRIHLADQLNNTVGQIGSNGATQITAQNLINQGGTLQAANNQALTLHVSQLLDNSQQGIIAGSAATILNTGSLNNTLGQITSASALDIAAAQAVNNTQGLIASGGSLNITTTGITRNDSGRLQATGAATLINTGLSNATALATPAQGGEIYAGTLSINTQSQNFNNQRGTVIASQAATLNTGDLNNQSGLIQSTGALLIDTHGQTLTNTNASNHASGAGGINSQASASITSGDLNNRAGFIGAAQALRLANNQITNIEHGQIASLTDLSLTASGLDNRGGSLQALGNLSANIIAGSIHNASLGSTTPGSIIRAGQSLSITVNSIINTNTLAAHPASPTGSQGLEGNEVHLNASSIDNRAGAIRANASATLTSTDSINNSAGLISANLQTLVHDANLAHRSLSITNTDGTIIAGNLIAIQAASISGDGQLLSQNDLNINLTQNLTNSGVINATRNVSITSSADITNTGKLLAGNTLDINTSNLTNQTAGEISASTTRITATSTATNRGLIDGVDTQINTNRLNNLGIGRIYGDNISIAAQTLINDKEGIAAPVIAARQQLDIGAQTLNNNEGALMFSAGDIAVAGGLDANRHTTVGKTALLTNASATIEALGNITIQAGQINNLNNHFATQVIQIGDPVAITEYRLDPGDGYRASDIVTRYNPSQVTASNCLDVVCVRVNATGDFSDAHTRYDINRTIYETVVTQSDPGKILAGGQISLDMDNLLNDRSNIVAGGNLNIIGGSVNNTTVTGERTIHDNGTANSYYRIQRKGTDRQGLIQTAYAPADRIESITLNPTRFEANTAPTSTGIAISTRAIVNVSAALSAASAANANLTQASAPASASISPVTTVSTNGPLVARTIAPNTAFPNNSLFRPAPSTSGFLVETDPRFANYRNWLSSDYLLSALKFDPTTMQKRLGDGFYEQKMVREQIAQLTGQRFLGDYTSDEAQYQALMSNTLTQVNALQLRPGIALTEAQMAQLTSDIVWLVSQSVTLPDGRIVQALVPQVYLRTQNGDLSAAGALLSGRNVALDLSGDMSNSGTIAGRQIVNLSTNNVHNLSGRIQGNAVNIKASHDINNIAGSISAANTLQLQAGRDINVTSSTTSNTSQAGANRFTSTSVSRLAGLYVTGVGADGKAVSLPEGERPTLIASAGRDLSLQAAQVVNTAAQGNVQLSAGNNLNLTTVTTSSSESLVFSARNKQSGNQSQEVGSQIQANGNITVQAGHDVTARAATVQAGEQLAIAAGRNINIEAGQASANQDSFLQVRRSGTLSSTTTTAHQSSSQSAALPSSLGGQSITINAGRDLSVQGSQVIADKDVALIAARDVRITSEQNTASSSNFQETKKSGIMGSGGIGFSIGKQQQSQEQQSTQTSAAASTIGSTGGNVTIRAGQTYTQTGSDILTPAGDITIAAKKVDIQEARETSSTSSEQKFKQSGLTVALGGGVISAAQGIASTAQAIGNTQNSRMQALGAASAALQAKDLGTQVNNIAQLSPESSLKDASAASGINLTVSLGSSSSQSNQSSSANTARGSSLSAGGNVTIQASGADKDSDITLQGSSVQAAGTTRLSAQGDVNLLAAANTSQETNSTRSKSGSIGISLSAAGLSANASASKSKGAGQGNSTNHTNTQVSGQTVEIESGSDTTIKGAVVQGRQVNAQVGGNLNIESLQDTSQYSESSKSSGFSVSVPITGGSFGASASAGKSNINSNYASVTEQSGIKAGDGGFNVNVAGNTALTGAVITSTQKAADEGKNSFESGGNVILTDIQNTASYRASGSSATIGVGSSLGSSSAGAGSASGSASSTTVSGITALAGDKTVTTGKDTTNALTPIFNRDQVQAEVNAQTTITASFHQQASKAIGDFAKAQYDKAKAEGDQAGMQAWEEGGASRVALHTLAGALTGGMSGALGAGASQASIPAIAAEIAKLDVPVEVKQGLIAAAGAAIGAATGNIAGAAAAINATTQNFLSASDIRSKNQKLSDCRAKGDPACEVQVLKDYDALSAKNTANINYKSVLTESSLKAEKEQLERLIGDSTMSEAAKAEARKSIKELDVAINVIQKSPVLRDAAELGLMIADVATLGELAVAKALSAATVRQFIKAKTGKKITEIEAARIANNFYAEGTNPPNWTPGKIQDIGLNATEHWVKHGSEFPSIRSANEFAEAANRFVTNPPAGTQVFTRPNGDKLFYDPSSNTFAAQASSGMPRTMFKPDAADQYWLKQIGMLK